LSSSAGLADVIRDQEDIEVMAAQFRSAWKETSALILYEDPMLSRNLELTPWFQADARAWDRVIYMLAQHPADLLQIGSREFEQLIAELLHRSGYTGVELTSSSHDGGRDLLVTRDTELGRHLYLVECKRYSPNNPVDVRLVRQLHGVAEAECATAALLVTTSYFTKGAVAFQEQVPHRMSLTDYRQLVTWLQKVNAGRPK
jgi:restriction endonuclease Mrr